jgi:hypothetical protein
VGTEFDVFEKKPVQTGVPEKIETWYNPISSINQNDLEFLKTGDPETYIDMRIKILCAAN